MQGRMSITTHTHTPVFDTDGHLLVNDGHLVLYDNIAKELCAVPLTDTETLRTFGYSMRGGEIVHNIQSITEHASTSAVPGTSSETQANVASESDEESAINVESKVWTSDNTLFLIDCKKKYDKYFSDGIKKDGWKKIADSFKNINQNISPNQCLTKWKGLVRTYKRHLKIKNTSGESKRYWEYFNVMHNIMFHKPEITPIATCGSLQGLKKSTTTGNSSAVVQDIENESEVCEEQNQQQYEKFESSFTKKRKQQFSAVAKRHEDKMQRLDRFNDLFQAMVDKMPSKPDN